MYARLAYWLHIVIRFALDVVLMIQIRLSGLSVILDHDLYVF